MLSGVDLDSILVLQGEVRKQQKKNAEENLHKVVLVATEIAETAASEGTTFCITRVYTEYNKITLGVLGFGFHSPALFCFLQFLVVFCQGCGV
ncbi:hypothetical protein LINPERHAP1_LOCUS10690 [Linum perenne]